MNVFTTFELSYKIQCHLCTFSGITAKESLVVSAVIQKAFIEVNEDGSEAAAATAVVKMKCSLIIYPRFSCDQPFLYLIKDKLSGLILFGGRVENPTKN
jgi:serine protease inhibitor